MVEAASADLDPLPRMYESSRGVFDTLVGEDKASPLIEASSTGDVSTLRTMLAQSPWSEIVLESPHCIYSEHRPRRDESESDVRGVLAMPMLNLERMILKAAENGHASAVSVLLDFVSQHSIEPSSVIGRSTIKKTVEGGHAAVFKVLAAADPTIATFDLGHETQPLELAIRDRDPELAAVLLQLGAARSTTRRTGGSYRSSLLSRAAQDSTMMELLLQHGQTVAGSGALHTAAERGALDSIRLLLDHGADANERLPESGLPRAKRSLYASWTPMHFAASTGQAGAMELLESRGAQRGVEDENGKTAVQLWTERQ